MSVAADAVTDKRAILSGKGMTMAFHTKTLMGLAALAALASLAVGGDAPAEPEMVDNPQYASWASFEVGAMVKMKSITLDADEAHLAEMTTTRTLTSLDAERAIVTMQTTITAAGMEMEQPAMEVEVLAQVPVVSQDPNVEVSPEVEQGEETIEVPAGTFECQFTKTTVTVTVNGQEYTSVMTVWTNDQVPGGQVKMVSVSSSQIGEQTTTSELMEYGAGGEE